MNNNLSNAINEDKNSIGENSKMNELVTNVKKWLFIVIDWTDWSGKGTQTKILVDRLRAAWYDVEIADFPQYWKKSAWMVEEYLNWNLWTAEEVWPYRASVLYAVDRYEASPRIKKRLEEWKIVICNR